MNKNIDNNIIIDKFIDKYLKNDYLSNSEYLYINPDKFINQLYDEINDKYDIVYNERNYNKNTIFNFGKIDKKMRLKKSKNKKLNKLSKKNKSK